MWYDDRYVYTQISEINKWDIRPQGKKVDTIYCYHICPKKCIYYCPLTLNKNRLQ